MSASSMLLACMEDHGFSGADCPQSACASSGGEAGEVSCLTHGQSRLKNYRRMKMKGRGFSEGRPTKFSRGSEVHLAKSQPLSLPPAGPPSVIPHCVRLWMSPHGFP